jgi:hypothetical protein
VMGLVAAAAGAAEKGATIEQVDFGSMPACRTAA